MSADRIENQGQAPAVIPEPEEIMAALTNFRRLPENARQRHVSPRPSLRQSLLGLGVPYNHEILEIEFAGEHSLLVTRVKRN